MSVGHVDSAHIITNAWGCIVMQDNWAAVVAQQQGVQKFAGSSRVNRTCQPHKVTLTAEGIINVFFNSLVVTVQCSFEADMFT